MPVFWGDGKWTGTGILDEDWVPTRRDGFQLSYPNIFYFRFVDLKTAIVEKCQSSKM